MTSFDLDANGCAINVHGANGVETEASEQFEQLANDPDFTVDVHYHKKGEEGGSHTDAAGVSVDKSDIDRPYGTHFLHPGVCSTSPGAKFNLPSIVTHELGHGYGYFKGMDTNANNANAILWENTVHFLQHEPLRDPKCHVKESQ